MRKIIGLLFFISFSLLATYAQDSVRVSGSVFLDKNGNGIKDKNEKGIKNIPISDGENIVLTDKHGNYKIKTSRGISIFPILPSDYVFSSAIKIGNENFCYLDIQQPEVALNHDFALIKKRPPLTFTLGAIGDIQIKNWQEVHYMNQSLFKELSNRKDIDFNIILGDLVNDKMELLPVVKEQLNTLNTQSWTVLGNHDRSIESPFQDMNFNQHFGASNYAFNYGNIHFIVLNNVYPKGKKGYEGRLSEKQLKFIRNSLNLVDKEKQVVLSFHIPLLYTKNKEEIIKLLADRKVLVLSGHTHQVSRHFYGDNIQELVAGATCGSWWTGERDYLGLPLGLMQCGTPRGYFTIEFDKDSYKINYKGIDKSATEQMDIWMQGQDSIDNHIIEFSPIKKKTIIANVYGGSEHTKVKLLIDETINLEMERVEIVAPTVSRIITLNEAKVYPSKHSSRGALRKKTSPHIWKAQLPDTLLSGLHKITINAHDEYGFRVEQRGIIQVQ